MVLPIMPGVTAFRDATAFPWPGRGPVDRRASAQWTARFAALRGRLGRLAAVSVTVQVTTISEQFPSDATQDLGDGILGSLRPFWDSGFPVQQGFKKSEGFGIIISKWASLDSQGP